MNIKSTKIFELFKLYKSHKLVFIKPVGNWGDELIFKGAEKLAKLAGITYESVYYDQFMKSTYPSDHVLYVYGNGGFNNIWNGEHIREFSKAVSTHSGVVILGPTTFAIDHEFLTNTILKIFKDIKSERVYMFARGLISYNALLNIIPADIILDLDHDTALNLESTDLLANVKVGKGTLFAIRNDEESIKLEKFKPLLLWFDPIEFAKSFQEWLLIHDGAQEIVTNRLHSAILGIILGKKVTLLPNCYHKNHCLWEFSLKDQGVIWEDRLKFEGIYKFLMKNNMYRWAVNSYKLKHFMAGFYIKSLG